MNKTLEEFLMQKKWTYDPETIHVMQEYAEYYHEKKIMETYQRQEIVNTPEQPTLRDQFAMVALQLVDKFKYLRWDDKGIGKAAYNIADAMLKEREK